MMALLNQVRAWLNGPLSVSLGEIEAGMHEQMARLERQIEKTNEDVSQLSQGLSSSIFTVHMAGSFYLMSAGMAARSARLRHEIDSQQPRFTPHISVPYEETLRRLQSVNPMLFPVWYQLFENGARSYVEERLGSCSHREHQYALLFGAYVEIYGHGRILDIGCGTYGMPSYLATRRPDLVSGLEPLPLSKPTTFEVARGFNEFLPWGDAEFDTIVSGTSLDHVLSIDASLAEVRRVLKPRGHYLVWLASIPGAAVFDERAKSFSPVDRFHLFHFDRAWVEPVFEKYFHIDDVTIIPQPGFDHVFYCMSHQQN